MSFNFEERLSDSPFVQRIWRTQSESPSTFTSLASPYWEVVVTIYQGRTSFTVRGPETKATQAECPPDAQFFGIIFKMGTFMPHLPALNLLDRKDATLPEASSQSFWLNGSAWQFPDFDNADTFVSRLVRQGLLVQDPVVDAALQGHPHDLSIRQVRRRFLRVTGLTQGDIRQIERARHALTLLQRGTPILDTVFEAGYFDQSHLTRSLKLYAGRTPAQILTISQSDPMSFLYNTQYPE